MFCPKTADTTRSVNHVGGLVGNANADDSPAVTVDDCRDSESVVEPASEGDNDGNEVEEDKDDTFFVSIAS